METLFKADNMVLQVAAPDTVIREVWHTYHRMRYDLVIPSFLKFLQLDGYPACQVRIAPSTYESNASQLIDSLSMN